MDKILDAIGKEVKEAFAAAGYDAELGRVGVSNRPDLCEYQCNGAMAGAKQYHKAPIAIATEVAEKLQDSKTFSKVEAVAPGFLNLNVKEEFLTDYLKEMQNSEKYGVQMGSPKKIVIDYGGPNVAKPLHVGHLRSAIIGESIKRICRYFGNEVIGDIHLGDWGLQMGLIIYELSLRKPELPYFDESFSGEYPAEAPFTLAELEEIYPTASGKSKVDEDYKAKALDATWKLQNGHKGYQALWKHIMNTSVPDLKKNYETLHVDFDLWNGESTIDDLIKPMAEKMKADGFAYVSEGALVVDVKEDTDSKELPPCMILKTDGAALYTTTDLATIQDRMDKIGPDEMIYVADKRQELHFEQVFRCAKKTGLVKPETKLLFQGFGTMNGKDGKPFKTREGGVMRLEVLIRDIQDAMYKKITESDNMKDASEEEAKKTSDQVALSAIKYGDLSNQASKDYIFDIDRFISFEGDTGPYVLYTMVRIKSILSKFTEQGGNVDAAKISVTGQDSAKDLERALCGFGTMMQTAYEEIAPHRICAYVYDLANALNHFYHETKILTEEDAVKKASYIALLSLTLRIMETCIDLLGFEAPERM